MQVELIETHRLRGERIRQYHWQLWFDLGTNPTVMATLGGIWSQEKAQDKLQWNCEQWNNYGHGQWMFFDKSIGAFIGRGGIRKVMVNDNDEVELGYALMPEFWGQGLAIEVGEKALSVAFNKFGYPSVVGYTLVENKRSARVLQKLGFLFEGNIIYANQLHALYRYRNFNNSAA